MGMTALALTLIRSLPVRFPEKISIDYVLYAGAGFFAAAVMIVGSVFAYDALSACRSGESLLVYPHYSRKGIVTHYKEQCGMPHAGCTVRSGSADAPVYDCSPFTVRR